MKSFWMFVGCILVLLVVAWYLTNYVFISEEQKIYRLIEKGRLGVESGSVFSLNNILAANYQHANGADRALVIRGLQQLFQETKERSIQLGSIQIEIQDGRATGRVRFSFDAQLTAPNSRYQKYITNNQMHELRVEFVKNKNGWEILRTDYFS